MNRFDHALNGRFRPARRVTKGELPGYYGPDAGRELIVSLEAGDIICFRPKGTRQRYTASAFDLFKGVHRLASLNRAQEAVRRRKERRA